MIIYYNISVADLRCTVPPAQSVHVLLHIYLSALGRVLRWVGKSKYIIIPYRYNACGTVLSRELVVKRIKFDFATTTTTTTQFCSPVVETVFGGGGGVGETGGDRNTWRA